MRKIVFASLMTMATIAPGSAGINHAFYAGVGLAGVGASHDATINYLNIINNLPANSRTDTYQFAKINAGADIMLGYMLTYNNLFIGAEVDWLFNNFNKTNSLVLSPTLSDTVKVESTGGALGLALRLGYNGFDRIQPYIRLGIENRRFKLTASSVGPGVVPITFFTAVSSSAHKIAFTPGVGVDFKVTKNFAFGLEYRYAIYSSITKQGFQSVPAVLGGRVTTFKLTPRVSTGLVSFKYIWG